MKAVVHSILIYLTINNDFSGYTEAEKIRSETELEFRLRIHATVGNQQIF